MTYDLLGRKKTMIDPDMGSWQYQYDAVGNLTGQRDGRNQWLYLEYDDLNRLIRKRRDTASTGPKVAEYLYDATGQKGLLDKSLAYDSAGTTVQVEVDPVTYDNRNRITQQNWVVAGGGTFRMDYAYNEANQRTSMTYPGGNTGAPGETVSYTYNSVGQLNGASGSGVSYISSATYNAQGQLTHMVNDVTPNGLTRQWLYETNTLRLGTIQAGKSTVDDRQKLTYGYDNNGNVTSLIDGRNQDQRQCFQYDYLNRLTAAFTGNSGCTAYSATGTGPYNHSYGYNAIGNLTSYAGNSYTYGDAAHKHAVTAAFDNSYSYDANGNQTSRTINGVTSTFIYDYENRLSFISGGVNASFVYDADGNRVKSTVGGVTTVYIAGVFEFIENGATDKMTTYYDGNAMRRNGYGIDDGVFYLLQDHLKSSSSFVNQSGATLANNYYYPYGGNRGGAFSNLTTKRFTGQYHESSLPGGEGLSYYNARWYDPQLGRFLSADTLVPGPANPQALNRYSYVFNNPLRFTDPSGHDPCDNGGKCYGEPPRGGNPYSPIRYPRSQGTRLILGTKPYPAVSPLYFYGFELPFGNGGTSGIFGDGKQYSSLHAKWEGDFIVTCWFTESCGARVFFGPYSALTQDIRAEPGVQKLREAWAAQNYGLPFRQGVSQEVRDSSMTQDARMINGAFVLLRENWQMIANMFSLGSTTPEGTLDPVGGVVGGYTINLYDAGDGLVLFEAVNVTSLGSGSRIPGTSRTYIQSRPQSEPGPGGNFTQIFYWWERMPQ